MKSFDELRAEYLRASLSKSGVCADPVQQFRAWLDEAIAEEQPLANACALATSTGDGRPSNRIVLLKSFDELGFVFFTNYESRKGQELETNPFAELLFWWPPLERQIRIHGEVRRISHAQSDDYFASRPRGSNLAAIVSHQSAVVEARARLDAEVAEFASSMAGQKLNRPLGWGGYRLVPSTFEFWQGREDRLHDRLRYRTDGPHWVLERLYP